MASKLEDELAPYEVKKLEGLQSGESRGAGSYGSVYRVKVNGYPCIAKRLHDILVGRIREVLVSDEEKAAIQARFRVECVILSKLRHPNIVQFIGVHYGRTRDDLTLVMECLYTDLDKCLQKCVKEGRTLPLSLQLSILLDVSYGLLYLHTRSKPVVHRDLKAENVLLAWDMRAKLADLGASKILNLHPTKQTAQTKCPGSQGVMPPEALVERPKYDEKLDDFSFGTLVLNVANQEFAYPYEVQLEQCVKGEVHIAKRRTAIEKMGKGHCLYDLVIRCLQDDPKKRPTTAEICETIEHLVKKCPQQFKDVLEMYKEIERVQEEQLQSTRQFQERLQQQEEEQQKIHDILTQTEKERESLMKAVQEQDGKLQELQHQMKDKEEELEMAKEQMKKEHKLKMERTVQTLLTNQKLEKDSQIREQEAKLHELQAQQEQKLGDAQMKFDKKERSIRGVYAKQKLEMESHIHERAAKIKEYEEQLEQAQDEKRRLEGVIATAEEERDAQSQAQVGKEIQIQQLQKQLQQMEQQLKAEQQSLHGEIQKLHQLLKDKTEREKEQHQLAVNQKGKLEEALYQSQEAYGQLQKAQRASERQLLRTQQEFKQRLHEKEEEFQKSTSNFENEKQQLTQEFLTTMEQKDQELSASESKLGKLQDKIQKFDETLKQQQKYCQQLLDLKEEQAVEAQAQLEEASKYKAEASKAQEEKQQMQRELLRQERELADAATRIKELERKYQESVEKDVRITELEEDLSRIQSTHFPEDASTQQLPLSVRSMAEEVSEYVAPEHVLPSVKYAQPLSPEDVQQMIQIVNPQLLQSDKPQSFVFAVLPAHNQMHSHLFDYTGHFHPGGGLGMEAEQLPSLCALPQPSLEERVEDEDEDEEFGTPPNTPDEPRQFPLNATDEEIAASMTDSDKIKRLQTTVDQFHKKYEDTRRQLEEEKQTLSARVAELEQELEAKEHEMKKLEVLGDEKEKIQELTEKVKETQQEKTMMQTKSEMKEREIERLRKALMKATEGLDVDPKEADAYLEQLVELTKKVTEHEVTEREQKKKIEDLQKVVDRAHLLEEHLTQAATELSEKEEESKQLHKALKGQGMEEMEDEIDRLRPFEQQVKDLQSQLEEAKQKVKANDDKIRALEEAKKEELELAKPAVSPHNQPTELPAPHNTEVASLKEELGLKDQRLHHLEVQLKTFEAVVQQRNQFQLHTKKQSERMLKLKDELEAVRKEKLTVEQKAFATQQKVEKLEDDLSTTRREGKMELERELKEKTAALQQALTTEQEERARLQEEVNHWETNVRHLETQLSMEQISAQVAGIEATEQAVSSFQHAMSEANADRNILREKLERVTNQRDQINQRYVEMRAAKENLEAQMSNLDDLQSCVTQMKADAERWKETIAHQKEELHMLRASLAIMSQENQELKGDVEAQSSASVAAAGAEIDRMKRQLQIREKEISRLKSTISVLSSTPVEPSEEPQHAVELARLKKQLKEKDDAIRQLQRDMSTVADRAGVVQQAEEIEKLNVQVKQRDQEILHLHAQVKQRNQEIVHLRTEKSHLQASGTSGQPSARGTSVEVVELQRSLREKEEELAKTTAKVEHYQKTAYDLTKMVHHAKGQSRKVKELREQLDTVEGEKSQLLSQKDELAVMKQSVEFEINSLQRAKAGLEVALRTSENGKERLERLKAQCDSQLKTLQVDNSKLQQQLREKQLKAQQIEQANRKLQEDKNIIEQRGIQLHARIENLSQEVAVFRRKAEEHTSEQPSARGTSTDVLELRRSLREKEEELARTTAHYQKTANDLTKMVHHAKGQSRKVKELREQLDTVEKPQGDLTTKPSSLTSVSAEDTSTETVHSKHETQLDRFWICPYCTNVVDSVSDDCDVCGYDREQKISLYT